MTAQLPKVAVIGTGGSISMLARDSLVLYEYGDFGKRLEVDELLERVPELASVADLKPIRFRAINSSSITPEDWVALVQRIDALALEQPDLDSIVVTHGPASLEETVYFLHLTTSVHIPVVMVAAQRPPNGLSSDAGLNLLNAIRVASAPVARCLGTLVVLNDELHSAREVAKTSNRRLQTFRTPDSGCLGHADPDGQIAIYRKPTSRHSPDTESRYERLSQLPRVDIGYAYAGAGGVLFDAAIASGARAIVLAEDAPGRPATLQRRVLLNAANQGVLVVLSSRAGSGRAIPRVGDAEPGFIAGDNLNPQKARVLTMLALTVTQNGNEIRRIFAEY